MSHRLPLKPISQNATWARWRIVWPDTVQEFGLELATGRWVAEPTCRGCLPVLMVLPGDSDEATQSRIWRLAAAEGFVFADGSAVTQERFARLAA